jgi:putative tricarboxylic transport membrane protein
MKKANFILAGIIAILAIYVIITALKFPQGMNGVPGPGVFPIMLATILLASSIAIVISSFTMGEVTISWLDDSSKRVYLSMIALIVYAFILAKVGFIVSTILFMSGMVQWFKKGKPIVNVAISAVFVGLVYAVFSILLKVPMDFGILI